MEVNPNLLLQIIGEYEVARRMQSAEIEALKKQIVELKEPTPIKQEAAKSDG